MELQNHQVATEPHLQGMEEVAEDLDTEPLHLLMVPLHLPVVMELHLVYQF